MKRVTVWVTFLKEPKSRFYTEPDANWQILDKSSEHGANES